MSFRPSSKRAVAVASVSCAVARRAGKSAQHMTANATFREPILIAVSVAQTGPEPLEPWVYQLVRYRGDSSGADAAEAAPLSRVNFLIGGAGVGAGVDESVGAGASVDVGVSGGRATCGMAEALAIGLAFGTAAAAGVAGADNGGVRSCRMNTSAPTSRAPPPSAAQSTIANTG